MSSRAELITSKLRVSRLAAFLGATLVSCALTNLAHSSELASNVKIVAEFPSGTFLENLHVRGDGSVLFTSYLAREIRKLDKDGGGSVFSRLPVHPVGIAAFGDGYIITAHGKPFTSGPEFTKTQQILVLDSKGAQTAMFETPDAKFLNGITPLNFKTFLAADSISGTIWLVDPQSQAIMPWLKDGMLAPDPAEKYNRPGANGLKRLGDKLLISNSSRGAIFSVAIASSGAAAGPLQEVAKTGPIDDFRIEDDGAIIFATHADKLVRLAPDGARTEILAEGCGGCTAVARIPSGETETDLVVLTTGGLLEGKQEPARVLRVRLDKN
jgi:sugar lactone lactonase YvrE